MAPSRKGEAEVIDSSQISLAADASENSHFVEDGQTGDFT